MCLKIIIGKLTGFIRVTLSHSRIKGSPGVASLFTDYRENRVAK